MSKDSSKYTLPVSNAMLMMEEIHTPCLMYALHYLFSFCFFPFISLARFMIKRAQGRNRFGIKNFKKRWFRLTNHEFTYHKTKGNADATLW